MMKISLFFFFIFLHFLLIHGSRERQTYIVYMGDVAKKMSPSATMLHHNLLTSVIGDEQVARKCLVHSYGKSFNAFAARLFPEEADKISGKGGVVSVFRSSRRKLHTTRSWDFIGFPSTVKRKTNIESNVIIGVFDTGIWANSPSFNDKGLGPPPSKWKGKCETTGNFSGCNNKLIGAKFFRLDRDPTESDVSSAVDHEGHGTHTSSTAAGVAVERASLFGLGTGTARGAVPSARIAMYKVCWSNEGCGDVDILAAFDEAIKDGVDIISISVGGYAPDYFSDPIAIGSFHAMKNGIFTSASAGNSGPDIQTTTNNAPWLMTVAASTIDRRFKTKIELGNRKKLAGTSINTFAPERRIYPLISGEDAGNASSTFYGDASACDYGTLDASKVKGKIVYCTEGMGGQDESVKASSGIGALIRSSDFIDTALPFLISSAMISYPSALLISQYINSTRNPEAVIHKSVAVVNLHAPSVASFSSRGPSTLSTRILKPDISAPGVDILAAYSRLSTVTGDPNDRRVVSYNILSGTSMACPHVAGAAAYVKSFHPSWSPAAIKSALITTAKEMWPTKQGEFGNGAGQVNPAKAVHPGLIYDIDDLAYIRFLCKDGVNVSRLQLITSGKPVDCSKAGLGKGSDGLNYPTMQFLVEKPESRFSTVFRRTVTNVGVIKGVYKAAIKYDTTKPRLINVTVIPDRLRFKGRHHKHSFKVVVEGAAMGKDFIRSAYLQWSDNFHTVRSPIVVYQDVQFLKG